MFSKRRVILAIVLIIIVTACITGYCVLKTKGAPGKPLNADQRKAIIEAAALMSSHGLKEDAELTKQLLEKKKLFAAGDNDPYLGETEKNGFTPYAYTLSDNKNPSGIVMAPRFFTMETSPLGRASLLIHELAHYRAYVATGKSDEVDGYRAQYDKSKKLGLSEMDGLVYWSMLDGVQLYVVPKYPEYKNYKDVKDYIDQDSGSSTK